MRKLIILLAILLTTCVYKGPVKKSQAPEIEDEITVSKACWSHIGGAIWVEGNPTRDCPNAEYPFTKEDLPLIVGASPDMYKEKAIKTAITTWNSLLETKVFVYLKDHVDPDIEFVLIKGPSIHGEKILAEAGVVKRDPKNGAIIWVYSRAMEKNEALKSLLYVHELGHVLGLRHDEDIKASIMYPKIAVKACILTTADYNKLKEILVD